MKVKVKFRDTEFGLFEPSFTVPILGSAERFRGIYLDFVAAGVPWSQLVLDEAMPRDWILDETWDENPVFASANDGVYWIIERILDSERECGEEIEIEYEGEDEMKEDNKKTVSVNVPGGTDRVTLNLNNAGDGETTLRSLLMAIEADKPVAVVVKDESKFPDGRGAYFAWRVAFPPSDKDSMSLRKDRVDTLAYSTLCDAGVLLDERKVDVGVSTDALGRYAITLSVKANG